MADLYCEQCGCRILAAWDVGDVRVRWETWGDGGLQTVRKKVVICTACLQEELEPVLTPEEAAIEAAFDHWEKEMRRVPYAGLSV